MLFFFHSRWRSVKADDDADFNYLDQAIFTNTTDPEFTVPNLEPYMVYSFRVAAVNIVGRSKPSKDSYPAVTLMESKSRIRNTFPLDASLKLISPFFLSRALG